jgi:hypothetical protein
LHLIARKGTNFKTFILIVTEKRKSYEEKMKVILIFRKKWKTICDLVEKVGSGGKREI